MLKTRFLHPRQTVRATCRFEGLRGAWVPEYFLDLLLPVAGARLSVALAVRGAVTGIRVSSSGWRGASTAWRWGVSRTGLVTWAGLGAGWHAVVGRLRGLGGIVLGREGSWRVLLGSLRWMGLLLSTLEACSWSGARGRSLGRGRGVVLKLLWLGLWRTRLGGSRLSAVSCRGQRCREEGRISWIFFSPPKEEWATFHITALISFYPTQSYSYQSTAYHTAAAGVERLVVGAGNHLEPGTAGTPGLQIQKQTLAIH